MKLLNNIETESFTTINFVSSDAKRIWKPIIRRCTELVQRLELVSVAKNQRRCAWRTVKVNEIEKLTRECMDLGLNTYPIQNIGSWGQGFTHKTKPAIDGKPMSTYCIITKSIEDALEYQAAFSKADHAKQGRMLGFPKCCTGFFLKNWPKYFDPIWQCATNSNHNGGEFGKNIIELHDYNPLANPILRYIGLRVGFHIPCSFNCEESVSIAMERLSLNKDKDDTDLKRILGHLLYMPMEWSVLNGIALVKTPIFYLRANSVPAIEKYTVRLHGDFIPREAVSGPGFPFNKSNSKINNLRRMHE